MKVLVNALSARKGGIVTYTRNLLGALESRGIDVIVSVPEEFDTPDRPSVNRMEITGYSPFRRFLWEQSSWRGIVKRHNPDILFSSANFGLLRSPVKQILLLREGGLFDPFYLANMTATQGIWYASNRYFRRKLMLLSAINADHIITPTMAMRDMVAQWEPSILNKCTVNPYGTINDMFEPGVGNRKWREDGTLRLLYVSVYYPHKVPNIISRAVQQLIDKGIDAHATITMTLREFEEMNGSALDKTVVTDAYRRGLITLGHHSYKDLPNLYGSHDVFVFPSVSETFGHPMAEAMSSGLPTVASDTPVNREICGDAALYFEPFSAQGLVEQLHKLDQDPELRRRNSNDGRQRALQNFGWSDHIDRLIETFEKVAHGGAKPGTASAHAA
ncbi:MAG: glycosyltransferase family 1 protein [Rhodospirillales bacterium]|jgi:glycosyltransferase involved in cell wall biosynthesis|nr:glycosyltransferase family 1 protein [Rhodospirillales bacterium]|tara:strand:+ start:689 stop:1852 length:1164 start_codon:yes stop_codon:yes gene_type:complete